MKGLDVVCGLPTNTSLDPPSDTGQPSQSARATVLRATVSGNRLARKRYEYGVLVALNLQCLLELEAEQRTSNPQVASSSLAGGALRIGCEPRLFVGFVAPVVDLGTTLAIARPAAPFV
jgi:hypothetical protein